MPTIDFTKQGNQIQVTEQGGQAQCFIGYPIRYSFDAAGTNINVSFGTAKSYSCTLADLRVAGSGSAPANVAAALTALSAVFGVYP